MGVGGRSVRSAFLRGFVDERHRICAVAFDATLRDGLAEVAAARARGRRAFANDAMIVRVYRVRELRIEN